MIERHGRCLCGAVSYKLSAEPLVTRVCWCRECQRIAANGTVNMAMPAEAVESKGELKQFVRTAASGNPIVHHFCPTCGSQMFGSSPARPHITIVRAGTLDDPSSVRPAMNIWTASAPVWACLDRGLGQLDGQAPVPAVTKPG